MGVEGRGIGAAGAATASELTGGARRSSTAPCKSCAAAPQVKIGWSDIGDGPPRSLASCAGGARLPGTGRWLVPRKSDAAVRMALEVDVESNNLRAYQQAAGARVP